MFKNRLGSPKKFRQAPKSYSTDFSNSNTGYWNTGDRNTGYFNTGSPKYIELFNKPISLTKYKSIVWPDWFYFKLAESDYKAY